MPGTAAAPNLSPAEFVRSLPSAFRNAVLAELLAGTQLTGPVLATDGEPFGVWLPVSGTADAADRRYAELPSETRVELMRPFLEFDWNDCLSDGEIGAILKSGVRG
ncbi:MAG: hypothetical protein ACRC7O_15335 [Fimbriiglobus sp.]